MDKWSIRKLTNEMRRHMRQQVKHYMHQLRFGKLDEEQREEALQMIVAYETAEK